jgi:hypothetical protein
VHPFNLPHFEVAWVVCCRPWLFCPFTHELHFLPYRISLFAFWSIPVLFTCRIFFGHILFCQILFCLTAFGSFFWPIRYPHMTLWCSWVNPKVFQLYSIRLPYFPGTLLQQFHIFAFTPSRALFYFRLVVFVYLRYRTFYVWKSKPHELSHITNYHPPRVTYAVLVVNDL